MRHSLVGVCVLSCLALIGAGPCSSGGGSSTGGTTSGNGGGKQQGEACTRNGDCDTRFVCTANKDCQPLGSPGTRAEGEQCAADGNCQVHLVCGTERTCTGPGQGVVGTPCVARDSCKKDLVCSAAGACAETGQPGTKQPGDACEGNGICAFGLVCANKVCTPLTLWQGATCDADSGPFRAYFSVPRNGQALPDFYRLPFPNNIRLINNKIDLTGHPNPDEALPVEVRGAVTAFFTGLQNDIDGFAVTPAIYHRFSKPFNLKTIRTRDDENGKANVLFVNLDQPNTGLSWLIDMSAGGGPGKYLCPNWIVFRPTIGAPLTAKTTYATIVLKGVATNDGTQAEADADLKVVLADAAPAASEADLLAAHTKYAPLREYLKAKGIATTDVISAAVFTTMDPRAKARKLREAVAKRPQPTLTKLTLCDGSNKSPCHDDNVAERNCPTTTNPKFHELHGVYQTPVFQQGTPPYTSEGGQIEYDGQGEPTYVADEEVCVVITIPKGSIPTAGWPVVQYAHGTGGNNRSFIGNGTAERLADVKEAGGAAIAQLAMVSIYGSQHGPRSKSTADPAVNFFNLRNPRAARDNVYRGVADRFQLTRLLKSLAVDGASSPTGSAIKFDPSKIMFLGHSQGSVEGTPFAGLEPDLQCVMLSGAGGYLLDSLLNKTKPINLPAAIKVALADPTVNHLHPLLHLMQTFFEEVDSMNYGGLIVRSPDAGMTSRPLFLSYGVNDGFTPPRTIDNLIRASGLPLLESRCGDDVCGDKETCTSCSDDCPQAPNCETKTPAFPTHIAAPVSNNYNGVTAAAIRYTAKDGAYDDHFVLSRHPDAQQQAAHFLATCARDGAPTLPAAL